MGFSIWSFEDSFDAISNNSMLQQAIWLTIATTGIHLLLVTLGRLDTAYTLHVSLRNRWLPTQKLPLIMHSFRAALAEIHV